MLFFLLAISCAALGFGAWHVYGAFLGAFAGAGAWLACRYNHTLEPAGPWLMLPVGIAFSFVLMDVIQHFGHEIGALELFACLCCGAIVWLVFTKLMPQSPQNLSSADN